MKARSLKALQNYIEKLERVRAFYEATKSFGVKGLKLGQINRNERIVMSMLESGKLTVRRVDSLYLSTDEITIGVFADEQDAIHKLWEAIEHEEDDIDVEFDDSEDSE
jgi:hypothetical protein